MDNFILEKDIQSFFLIRAEEGVFFGSLSTRMILPTSAYLRSSSFIEEENGVFYSHYLRHGNHILFAIGSFLQSISSYIILI